MTNRMNGAAGAEDAALAALGRKQLELDAMHVEYTKLLKMLALVVAGEVEASRVSVDLAARRWSCAPLPQDDAPAAHDGQGGRNEDHAA